MVRDVEQLEDELRLVAGAALFTQGAADTQGLLDERGASAKVGSEGHVLEHRHPLEEGDVLEGPRDPPPRQLAGAADGLALEQDLTRGGVMEAADDVQHRALARAVRADEGTHLAPIDREAHVVDGAYAVEGEGEPADLEQGVGAHAAARCFDSSERTSGRMR